MQPATRRFAFACTFLAAVTMPASVGWAGPHDHDGGFFLRLSGGGGYAHGSLTKTLEPSAEFSGAAADWSFAIGGMVARNVAVHGTIWGWLMPNPDWTQVDTTTAGNEHVRLSAMGGGVTYFFMPLNVYIAPSIGIGALFNESGDTDPRLAIDITLGKEWWVGNKWGIGLAGAIGYFSVPASTAIGESWSGTSIALRFTATLN